MTLHNGGRETALNTSVRRLESGIQFSSAFLPRIGARQSQAVIARTQWCLRRTRRAGGYRRPQHRAKRPNQALLSIASVRICSIRTCQSVP